MPQEQEQEHHRTSLLAGKGERGMTSQKNKAELVGLQHAMLEDGFSEEESDRLIRLITLTPTDEERGKWVAAGILSTDGKLIATEDEIENFDLIVVSLWNLAYEGKIQRVPLKKYRVMCVTWYEEEATSGEAAKAIVEDNCPGEYQYMRAEKII